VLFVEELLSTSKYAPFASPKVYPIAQALGGYGVTAGAVFRKFASL
jgi:hypothetical protein